MIGVSAKYRKYIEAELKRIAFECKQDAFERGDSVLPHPTTRLVPDEYYDPTADGNLIVIAVPPETPVLALHRESAA